MKRLLAGAVLVVAMAVPVVATGAVAVGGVATDGTGAEFHIAVGASVQGSAVVGGHGRIAGPTGLVLDGPVIAGGCSPTSAVVLVCDRMFEACGPFFGNATELDLDETNQTITVFQLSPGGTQTGPPNLVLTMTHGQITIKCQ